MPILFRGLSAWRILAALTLLLIATSPTLAESDDDDSSLDDIPHVTFVGRATVEVPADVAVLTFSVSDEADTVERAAAEMARKSAAAIAAAKARGIASSDIETASLVLEPVFDISRDPQGSIKDRKQRGYAAHTTLAIHTHDLDNISGLVGTLIAHGANGLDDVAFDVDDAAPVLARLTGEAVRHATLEAQAAAQAAGIHLGRLLIVQRPESDLQRSSQVFRFTAGTTFGTMGPSIQPAKVKLERSVEVTWAIDAN